MISGWATRSRQVALGASKSFLTFPSASNPATRVPLAARCLHSVPHVRNGDRFAADGVPDLFSRGGYELAWTQYMQHVLERLDNIIAGTPREHYDVHTLAMEYARNPATAHTFNFASMAHNNHFFFNTLSHKETQIPAELKSALEYSFSSIESLRETFLATAAAMFGPGFVWLVQQKDATNYARNPMKADDRYKDLQFRIVSTYLAGTPYPGAHHRQQSRDLNTENLQSQEDYLRHTRVQNTAGAFGNSSRGMANIPGGGPEDRKRFGGADVVPVLCVSTWEHTWMPDWGIKGKNLFLEQWWERIDWEAVTQNVDWPSSRPAPNNMKASGYKR